MSVRRSTPLCIGALVALVLSIGAVRPAVAADSRSSTVAARAVAWIATQQRDDGGFGQAESGFPGFETPDAVLAIADAAQRSLEYSPAAAHGAVAAITKNGVSPLHYLDDLADGLSSQPANQQAGAAAKLVVVAAAVGLDPTRFDPDGDGPTDLVATIDAQRRSDGSYGNFNGTLFVVLADAVLHRAVPESTVSLIESAQQSNGGWNFGGDASGTDEDIDSTGLAVEALVAAGRSPSTSILTKALGFLAAEQNADGSWNAFGSPDPNSTAMAILAITASGYRVDDSCWRDTHSSTKATYHPPDEWLRSQQATDGHITSPNDSYGVNTFATSQAVQGVLRTFQPVARAPRQPCPTTGYRIVGADGGVFAFGSATFAGSVGDRTLTQPVVDATATPTGKGYWLFAADGGVFSEGDATFLGSMGAVKLTKPVVAAAATPTGGGYWLFAADGGVFAFGDAAFLGSEGGTALNQPVVAAAATPSGRGYVLFAADGGVFAFGDAVFKGSAASAAGSSPIVAGAADRTGGGYWLFSANGGVQPFGDAPSLGSMAGKPLGAAIVGGAASRGDGYYLVGGDGGVFAFGDAAWFGSLAGRSLSAAPTAIMS